MKLVIKNAQTLMEMSRPSRARGLKQLLEAVDKAVLEVAPLTGAWIETGIAPG